MEVSVGLYALIFILFFLVLPGFIARRFYYHGEFSKTINWNSNLVSNFLSSLFVGIFLTIAFITTYNLLSNDTINLDDILNRFDKSFVSYNNSQVQNEKFSGFTSTMYRTYLPFIGGIYSFSAILGYLSSKAVLFLGLDTKWKLFRFRNNWYYLFEGKILKFKKTGKRNQREVQKVKHTYLDILVSEKGDDTTLFSGLYADYEVSYNDINKLEKIHLYKAGRWKRTDSKTELRMIPGHVFTIMADHIININTTYVYYEQGEISEAKFLFKKKILLIVDFTVLILYLLIVISIIFSINIFVQDWYKDVLAKSVIAKGFIILTLNMVLGLLTPFKIDNKGKKINFIGERNFVIKLTVAIITAGITWFIFIRTI